MMEKKLTWLTLVLVLTGLCYPFMIFAETIVLKSGKTIEAKIIERRDEYIKIEYYGVPLTYFFDEIESIDGEKPVPFSEEIDIEQDNNRQKVLEFLNKLDAVQKEAYKRKQSKTALIDTFQNNQEKIQEIILEIIDIFEQEIDQLKRLSTPKSCETLKDLAIKFAESTIGVYRLQLKQPYVYVVPGPGAGEQVVKQMSELPETKQLIESANKFGAERERIRQKYNIH